MIQRTYLVDEAQREFARNDLDRSLSVEAGAGTGKTTLLVERILSLLKSRRASLEEIVAITFTEKAAGELKVRLREVLERAIPLSSEETAEVLTQALENLERAPISTIHSLCASLLRERPVEASLDPNFEPLDELGMELLFQETWEKWLEKEIQKKAPALRRALALGMEMGPMAHLVKKIYENRDLISDRCLPRLTYSIPAFLNRFEELLKKLQELSTACQKGEDLGFQQIQDLQIKAQELKEAQEERKEVILVRDLEVRSKGDRRNWKPPSKCDEQKKILAEFSNELNNLKNAIRTDVMAGLIEWVHGFLDVIREEKANRGVLDFQDLLILARNLLRDNKEVRGYFQNRFRYILVDEFQDTDPLQVEVVFFLAEDGAKANHWEEVVLQPGKLYLVGDPKQSIYRFRRADIETYEKARQKLENQGGNLKIIQNFRTVPSIIDWVNKIFEDLIQPSEEGYFQPSYVPLVAHSERKEATQGQPGVILIAPPADFDPSDASADEVREREARSIAALIEEMVTGGSGKNWMTLDKKEKIGRPINYGDIAILFPTLTGVEAYEEALKNREIPYRLEGGKEFYMRQEVRSLLSCLKTLNDPEDGISLVAALRSPFFGFSDEEIFLIAASGNRLSYLHPPKEENPSFSEAFSLLRELHEGRNSLPISSTVEAIFSRTKALEFSLLRQGGEQVAANLMKVLDQARAFDRERKSTFRRFVEWLETREEEGVREGESPWSEEGEENVKLMTIHKAKGLEFPVVFMANLASQRTHKQEFIPLRLQGGFELAVGDFKTLNYSEALEQEKKKMEAEDRRLLYVASTRARDHLVLPLFWRNRNKGFFNLLEGRLPNMEEMKPWSVVDGQLLLGGGCFDLQPRQKPPLRLDLGESEEDKQTPLLRRLRWKEELEAIKRKASQGLPLLSPSAPPAGFTGALSPELFVEWVEDEVTEKGLADGGPSFGLAFHRVMERLDLAESRNLKELCLISSWEYSISGSLDKLERVARQCLNHPFMERVRRAKRLFREVPFSVSLGDYLVEGKIDLLFEEDGGWVIVDYKTDDVTGESLERRFQAYQEQGSWYSRAAHRATGEKIKEIIFFFVRPGEIRSIKPNET